MCGGAKATFVFDAGVGHVVVSLPRDHISTVIRQICWAQIQPLNQLCEVRKLYR
jgi:hypothetical protein